MTTKAIVKKADSELLGKSVVDYKLAKEDLVIVATDNIEVQLQAQLDQKEASLKIAQKEYKTLLGGTTAFKEKEATSWLDKNAKREMASLKKCANPGSKFNICYGDEDRYNSTTGEYDIKKVWIKVTVHNPQKRNQKFFGEMTFTLSKPLKSIADYNKRSCDLAYKCEVILGEIRDLKTKLSRGLPAMRNKIRAILARKALNASPQGKDILKVLKERVRLEDGEIILEDL